MKIIDCVQGSDEWFAVKLGKVSSSKMALVKCKGSGRKTYMYKLAAERLTGVRQVEYEDKAMKDGTGREPEAREYYSQLYGCEVTQVGFVELNDDVGCSPDGLVGDKGEIEIKCPYPNTHIATIIKNEVPTVYVPQIQSQLWITEREWCDFVSFDARVTTQPCFCKRVYRDEKEINIISIAVETFVEELKKIISQITNTGF